MGLLLIEGSVNGEDAHAGFLHVGEEYVESGGGLATTKGSAFIIPLKNNLIAVDIIDQEKKTGGGIGGAAAGAVLGFLIAGPVGTAVGAGIGRHQTGRESLTFTLSFLSGDYMVVKTDDARQIAQFQKWVAINQSLNAGAAPEIASAVSTSANSVEGKKSAPVQRKVLSGRANKNVDLPQLELLSYWESKDESGGTVPSFCFAVILQYAREYNTFKWRTADKKLSTKAELTQLAAVAVSRVSYVAGRMQSSLNRKVEIDAEREEAKKLMAELHLECERLQAKIQGWNVFGRSKAEALLLTAETSCSKESERLERLTSQESYIDDFLSGCSPLGSPDSFEAGAKNFFRIMLGPKVIQDHWEASASEPLNKAVMSKIMK